MTFRTFFGPLELSDWDLGLDVNTPYGPGFIRQVEHSISRERQLMKITLEIGLMHNHLVSFSAVSP